MIYLSPRDVVCAAHLFELLLALDLDLLALASLRQAGVFADPS